VLAFAINVHSAQFPPSALWSAYPIPSLARLSQSLARLSQSLARLTQSLARLSQSLARLSQSLARLSQSLARLTQSLASHSSLFGHWFPCSGRKHKDFAQSSQLINPTQSPTLLLWVFVGFCSLKGEIYFRAGYLVLNLWLYLCFFKNGSYME
jgi:hypothetical protein